MEVLKSSQCQSDLTKHSLVSHCLNCFCNYSGIQESLMSLIVRADCIFLVRTKLQRKIWQLSEMHVTADAVGFFIGTTEKIKL